MMPEPEVVVMRRAAKVASRCVEDYGFKGMVQIMAFNSRLLSRRGKNHKWFYNQARRRLRAVLAAEVV